MTNEEIAIAHNITADILARDIPLDLARSAHQGTSFVPDERAHQERAEYAGTLVRDYLALVALCNGDDEKVCGDLAEEFQRYREGFRARFVRMLAAKSRCLSTMITGRSGFNVRRAEKTNDAADKRTQELIDYRARALKAIRRTLDPTSGPIMASDDDAIERLEAKLIDLMLSQEQMKEANAAIRSSKKAGPAAQTAALCELGFTEKIARQLLTPDFAGRIGFPSYALTNNNAQIARVRDRIEAIKRAKATPATEIEGTAARLEDDPPANRVRLYFPGKPDEATRSRLKSSGFRWAPTIGAWQAYRNTNSLTVARTVAGVAT